MGAAGFRNRRSWMGDIRPPYRPEQQATIESRRDLHRTEGTLFRITLTPPGTQQRTDKPLLLRALGISADEFATRFCRTVNTSWRLTCTPCASSRRPPSSPAASRVINLRLATQVWHGHDGPRCPMPPGPQSVRSHRWLSTIARNSSTGITSRSSSWSSNSAARLAPARMLSTVLFRRCGWSWIQNH